MDPRYNGGEGGRVGGVVAGSRGVWVCVRAFDVQHKMTQRDREINKEN